MEKGRVSGTSPAAYPTWYIRSTKVAIKTKEVQPLTMVDNSIFFPKRLTASSTRLILPLLLSILHHSSDEDLYVPSCVGAPIKMVDNRPALCKPISGQFSVMRVQPLVVVVLFSVIVRVEFTPHPVGTGVRTHTLRLSG